MNDTLHLSAPHLSARGLVKSYSKGKTAVPVLRGVDLEVRRGELLSIVGPSGSGKSTLLHLLGTLDEPDSGAIYLNEPAEELTGAAKPGGRRPFSRPRPAPADAEEHLGRRIDGLRGKDRDRLRNRTFGFIFQFYHLLPELDLLENVTMPRMIRHGVLAFAAGRRRFRADARAILERVGLGHRMRHRPSELSGGEMQRAAIARALAAEPRLLLADEPTGNLDAATGQSILALLRSLNRERGLTMIVVTHDPAIAERADRIVHLTAGGEAVSDHPPVPSRAEPCLDLA